MNAFGSAIVVGAGVAGLVTAGVLSNHFARVVVFDRDDLEQGAAPRRGVPQGQHVHLLLAKGFEILNEMFPGLTEELIQAGAEPFGRRALLTLAGYLREHPPLDDQGFSEFALSLGSAFSPISCACRRGASRQLFAERSFWVLHSDSMPTRWSATTSKI